MIVDCKHIIKSIVLNYSLFVYVLQSNLHICTLYFASLCSQLFHICYTPLQLGFDLITCLIELDVYRLSFFEFWLVGLYQFCILF